MKAYYYLLFRIYQLYVDKPKEKSIIIFNVSAISAVIIYLPLFTFHLFLNYMDLLPMFSGKFHVILVMVLLGIVNYYLFIRPKKFLDYDFKKDFKGGVLIILFLLIVVISFILIANYNRAKIFEMSFMSY